LIDVVIPTVAGREDSLDRLIDSCKANTAAHLDFIVVRDEPTCGRAWQRGLTLCTNPFVWLACDDLEVTSPTWAGAAIEVVDAGQIPCPLIHRPDGSIESCGGDMSAPACLLTSKSDDGTPVDFTPSPFLSLEMAQEIGMHAGHYSTDVYVSHKGRRLGYPTVVCKDFQLTHHHSMVKRRQPTAEDTALYRAALDA
jgi:hypothetical protein